VRRALAVSALVLLAAGCGGRTSAPGPSGGASVAPASTALLVRVRTNDAAQWRTLARLLPENLPTLESLRGALGPETDVLALTGDEETPVVLTQPPNPAKLDSLLAKHDPPLVSEEVAEWLVVAPDRATIDRLKRARNAGSLVDTDAYKEATRDLSAPALVTFYADGAAATRALDRRLKTGLGPVPGLGRVGWIAGSLARRPDGLAVRLRVKGDEIEPSPYKAELPAEIPTPVTLFVDAKGLDRTLDELKRSPALADRGGLLVKTLESGALDDVIDLFRNEAAFYARRLPSGPELTLVVKVDDEAAADAAVDRLVILLGAVTQKVPQHQTIAGVDATKLTIGKMNVYYAVFDGMLVATTARSGIRGLVNTGPRLAASPAWTAAATAASLPDETAGLAYADVKHALPLIESFAHTRRQRKLSQFGKALLYATVDGPVLSVSGSVALR
jgi:Protein of unknown function (DUF3352)